mmetsp:Transcript_36194/g.58486  ORF Transcript_36194/g.58486 Transcript_36194/m.58486 type:complete len:355 (+) Transcript_36194:48-1112(+)
MAASFPPLPDMLTLHGGAFRAWQSALSIAAIRERLLLRTGYSAEDIRRRLLATLAPLRSYSHVVFPSRETLSQLHGVAYSKFLREISRLTKRSPENTALIESPTPDSCVGTAMTTATLFGVGSIGKIVIQNLNSIYIYDHEKLLKAVMEREGRGLLTVANHSSMIDDPALIATLLPYSVLADFTRMRWTLCAYENCFRNAFLSTFFRTGKVLPIVRGAGLEQEEMSVAIEKLNAGSWVHIFPEGRIVRTGDVGPLKKGVGKLVADADPPPIVVPFYHDGMEDVLPLKHAIPRIGQKVFVAIGEPIEFSDLLQRHRVAGSPPSVIYRAVTDRIDQELRRLRERVLAMKQEQLPNF